MKRLIVGVAISVLVFSACDSGSTEEIDELQERLAELEMTTTTVVSTTTSTIERSTTTATPATTASSTIASTAGSCTETVSDTIRTFGVVFDRIDADPQSVLDQGSEVEAVMADLGRQLGSDCAADPGGAISEIIIYLAEEATIRPPLTQAFLEPVLESFCVDLPVALTMAATTACALSGH